MASQSPVRFQRRKADLESLWLMTFADLMVQLMAFFALLYSFSVADQTKLQLAVASIQKALGVQPAPGLPTSGDGILPGSTGMDPSKASDLEKLLNEKPDERAESGAVFDREAYLRDVEGFDDREVRDVKKKTSTAHEHFK